MRRITTLFAILLYTLTATAQQNGVMNVDLLRNEKWYGISRDLGHGAPKGNPSMIVSNAGRYIWSESPMSFSADRDKLTVNYSGTRPTVQKGGKTLREAYLTCRHKNMPPDPDTKLPVKLFTSPVYGMPSDGMRLQGQDAILAQARIIKESGMPAGTIVIADGWQSVNSLLEFDRELYPDPSGMVRTLHDDGFTVMLSVTPYIRTAGKLYHTLRNSAGLLKDGKGGIFVTDTPAGYSACYDIIAHGEEFRAAIDRLSGSYNIDGFIFDCIQAEQLLKESKGGELWPFINSWNRVVSGYGSSVYMSELAAPANRACVLPLAADNGSLPDALTDGIILTLNSGLSGNIYTQYYYNGSSGAPNNNTTLLTAQAGLFMPMQFIPFYSGTGPAYRDAMVKSASLRNSMAQYMEELLKESAKTGEPLVRHLDYQFPGQGFANCDDQFMLGSRYLVAPVLEKAEKRTVRLPKGTWVGTDGARHKGPRVISVDVSSGQVSVFTHQGK